jgi:tRNA modification GTPase
MPSHETIAAIATPPGTGGIGILRLSGARALAIGEAISESKIKPGLVQFRQFFDADGTVLDHGLCLYFKAPHSFSGEDCVEISICCWKGSVSSVRDWRGPGSFQNARFLTASLI